MPSGEGNRGSESKATCGMIESIGSFINRDRVKALLTMEDTRKSAFERQVNASASKAQGLLPQDWRSRATVRPLSTLVMQGQSKHGCVCLRQTHIGKKRHLNKPEWTVLMAIIKDNLGDTTVVARKNW